MALVVEEDRANAWRRRFGATANDVGPIEGVRGAIVELELTKARAVPLFDWGSGIDSGVTNRADRCLHSVEMALRTPNAGDGNRAEVDGCFAPAWNSSEDAAAPQWAAANRGFVIIDRRWRQIVFGWGIRAAFRIVATFAQVDVVATAVG